jgi:hypothetical protein
MATDTNTARILFTADETETVRVELKRILASPLFQASKRCHDFLQHIVTRTLEGELDGLTERFLGAELFGRTIDYDTKSDSIVRVRANDVRRRLTEYYANQTSTPEVVIILGAGGCVPEFHWPHETDFQTGVRSLDSESSVAIPGTSDRKQPQAGDGQHGSLPLPAAGERSALQAHPDENASPDIEDAFASSAGLQTAQVKVSRRVVAAVSIVAGVSIFALAICSLTLWQELRAARQSLYPWRNSPAVAGFWGTFLGGQRDTDLVVTDSSLSLVEALTNQSFSLNDYLGHSYMSHLQDQDPKMAAALNRISNWGLGSSGEFEVAQRMLALDPGRQKLRFYLARKYQPDLIQRDNVILMGSRYGNPWAELFDSRMNFTFNPRNPYEILNLAPEVGESSAYSFDVSSSVGFCIIAYLPTPDHSGSALLIQGTSGEPTAAGVDFLLSEAKLSGFQRTLGVPKLPYFELLLKTSWVKGTPIDSSIVAYRTYTESN